LKTSNSFSLEFPFLYVSMLFFFTHVGFKFKSKKKIIRKGVLNFLSKGKKGKPWEKKAENCFKKCNFNIEQEKLIKFGWIHLYSFFIYPQIISLRKVSNRFPSTMKLLSSLSRACTTFVSFFNVYFFDQVRLLFAFLIFFLLI
jgi:hypothetical protein